jgi:hypothetical protein
MLNAASKMNLLGDLFMIVNEKIRPAGRIRQLQFYPIFSKNTTAKLLKL